jgi:hypothetical protein
VASSYLSIQSKIDKEKSSLPTLASSEFDHQQIDIHCGLGVDLA